MLPYPNRIKDPLTDHAFDRVIDYINNLEVQANQCEQNLKKLKIPTMSQIQSALQQGGSNPLNLTGLQPPCPPVSGGPPAGTSSYSDTLAIAPANARNVISPPSDDWAYVILGGDSTYSSPITMPTFLFAATLSGAGGLGLAIGQSEWGANPPYTLAAGIVPLNVFTKTSGYYIANQKFVQYTFNSNTAIQAGEGIFNFVDASGTGVAGNGNICHDCYLVDTAVSHYRVQRFNSIANPTQLMSVGTPTQGDIVRLSFDFTNALQVTITLKVNGLVAGVAIDNSANRITTGLAWPVIAGYSLANTALAEYKNFSCGTGL